jgi:3',5'-cyclic AMP phosphodiesterase CpdA
MRKNLSIACLCLLLCSLSIQLNSLSAFISDCQSVYLVQDSLFRKIAEHNPDFVFAGGDVTYYGSREDDFRRFNQTLGLLKKGTKFYPALGNHDNDRDLFLKYFPQVDTLTYYSIDADGIVWVILNSNLKLAPGSEQYNWLVSVLERNFDRTKVVVMHHTVYSSGPHGDEKGFNLLLPPLFSRYGVSAVLSGHDHIYERSVRDSIQYVVFGGGGFKLYNQESSNAYSLVFRKAHGFLLLNPEQGEMKATAYDIDGKVIDSFNFPIKTKAVKPE